MAPYHLNPLTILFIWGTTGLAMVWANYGSVREAWAQAKTKSAKRDWRFAVSFVGREQVAYAKRMPIVLGVLLISCVIAFLVPDS